MAPIFLKYHNFGIKTDKSKLESKIKSNKNTWRSLKLQHLNRISFVFDISLIFYLHSCKNVESSKR